MASTYSALKIELIGTGEQSGTWGTTTNTNLGDAALGEAITGSADVNYATAADVTVTLTDVNTTQSARNLCLNITESSTGIGYVGNLILGSGCQIEKFYLINNTGTGAKTVKNTSGTGISVPAGKATLVYNNGTNVVDAATYFSSLTLGSALPVASGGTGVTSSTGTVAVVLSNTPTLVTPVLGVATATSINKVALTAPATASTLTIADGKTLTASNSLTLAGTDATTMTFPATSATVAGLSIVQTFTAAQRGTITVLTDGATITPDFSVTNNYSVTLAGNRTLANPTNTTAGQSGSIFVSQDATGSRTLAYGTNWDFAGGTAPTLSTAASAVDRIDYVVRTATSIHAVFTANYS
ncbi:hypothetical protein CCP3SC1AL1_2710003 [Gammaproteobacteria bacterium]